MSILNALIAQRESQQNRQRDDFKDWEGLSDKKRLLDLGRNLMQYGDYSPEGLQKFAQQNGLGMQELAAVKHIVDMFQVQYQKQISQDEATGTKYNEWVNPFKPEDVRGKTPTELVELQRSSSFIPESGQTLEQGWNKFTNETSPITSAYTGESNIIKPVDAITKKFMTEEGTPLQQLIRKDTGTEIGAPWVAGESRKDKINLFREKENIKQEMKENKANEPKKLPAGQVSQMAEFGTYQKTMDEIQSMIDADTIRTGPFEFIKKIADQWGVLSNKDRIELRTLVSRLPGLMYAMRGKQLSDKELQVAREMMPKMSSDEEQFAIETKKFAEYMSEILKGKQEAFQKAGYSTGEEQPNINQSSPITADEYLKTIK